MSAADRPSSSTIPRWQVVAGYVLSALPVLGLLMSAAMKLRHPPEMVAAFTTKFGYPEGVLVTLGVVELLCTLTYLVPQTAALGAILLTGYLGGAVATHVRIGEPFAAPLLFGVMVWAGLFLRDPRIRALFPLSSLKSDAPAGR